MSSVWGTRHIFLTGTDDAGLSLHGPNKVSVQSMDSKLMVLAESAEKMAQVRPTEPNQLAAACLTQCRNQIRDVLKQTKPVQVESLQAFTERQEINNTRNFK
jgi:hypothetical protein